MKRILIIDDSAFMRLSLKQILMKNGFQVVEEAKNGFDGIKKYEECRPDMVTMDITMPDMDGIAALKAIKQIDSGAKVIIVSAMGQESIIKKAIAEGAKSFIIKPYKEEYVIKTLNSI